MTLAELDSGVTARVDALPDEPDVASQCASMGLSVGAAARVLRRAPFGGPLHVRVGDVELAIGRDLAARVRVSR